LSWFSSSLLQKSWNINSFGTCVAIVAGLRHEFVLRAMQRHNGHVPLREKHTLKLLAQVCDREDDFVHIRKAVQRLVDMGTTAGAPLPVDAMGNIGKDATMEGATHELLGCIPFIGEPIFVSFPK
jgi:hypothetical protein